MKAATGKRQLFVYGASGHGKVVADILQACGLDVAGFIDDDPLKRGEVFGLRVLGDGEWLVARSARQPVAVALGVGDNFARRLITERCINAGIQLLTAVHPTAVIAASAKLFPGAAVMARAIINPDAVIGCGAIVNTGAIVEHDCRIGEFAHLSPGVAIGGHVEAGPCSWLGIGAVVAHNVKIGQGSIIGAGATVLHDVGDWVIAVGTPARVLREVSPPPEVNAKERVP